MRDFPLPFFHTMGRRPKITEDEKSYYLTNKEMLAEWLLSKEQDRPTERFALALKLIAERSARKYANNDWYDDNVGNALLRMLENWEKFDPEKSENPFAYFTQVAKMEFFQLWHRNKNYVHLDLMILTGEFIDHRN
jgi:DNA-directed RNA polymerase specialized sigma24 family protein